VERPRLRWLEDLEYDLRETEVKKWRQKERFREELASVLQEAKGVRGPYNQVITKKYVSQNVGYAYYLQYFLNDVIPK
jgi:hypothetical protein